MIPLFKVNKPRDVGRLIEEVYNSGVITEGEYSDEFERIFGEYIGNPNVRLVNSGTSALTLAAYLCGINHGDEVITTPMTCFNQDANVQLSDGSTMRIGKIVNKRIPVVVKSYNTVTGKVENKLVTNWIKILHDSGEWYRVSLKHAQKVNTGVLRGAWVTGDHNILTKDGYKRVDQLTETDLIVTDRVMLNEKQLEFLDGCLLGDGYLSCRNNIGLSRFQVGHSIEQKEWIEIKEKIISGVGYYKTYKDATVGHSATIYLGTHHTVGFKKQRHRWYSSRRTKIIPPDLKLTPIVLATWYLDDGSISTTNAQFSCECFDIESFWRLFYKLVDIGFKPRVVGGHTNRRRITLDKVDTAILFQMIGKYVPPSMRYKLGNFDSPEYDDTSWNLGDVVVDYDTVIVEKFDKKNQKAFKYAYCLEVEDNHNFVITNMVVSNCMATSEPFYNMGATLKFADIDPGTGNILPSSVESLVTDKTKAIVVVHWAGQPVDLDEIHRIAKPNGIKVIEDAAHSLRAYYKGKMIGSHSDYVCFSFQAIKHLSTGDGGAIACKTVEDAERVRKLRWFGLDRHFKSPPGQPPASRWEQDITESGFKLHMNNITAAIGIRQMETIDSIIDLHQFNAKIYDNLIRNPNVMTLNRPPNTVSSMWIYSMLVEDRPKFKKYMDECGIATDIVHVRNDKYSVFQKFRRSLPGVDFFESRLTHIPVGWWLSEDDLNYIIECVNKYER